MSTKYKSFRKDLRVSRNDGVIATSFRDMKRRSIRKPNIKQNAKRNIGEGIKENREVLQPL